MATAVPRPKPTKQIRFWQAAWTDPIEPCLMVVGAVLSPVAAIALWMNWKAAFGFDRVCWILALVIPLFMWLSCWRSIWKKQDSINNGKIPFDTFFRENPNLGYYPEDKK